MNSGELVKLLDSYIGNDGYYIKPKISGSETSFFMAKGSASSGDVEKSFETVREVLSDRAEKETQLFDGIPKVECAVCADIPNLSLSDDE